MATHDGEDSNLLSAKDTARINALSLSIIEASTLESLFAELVKTLLPLVQADALVLAFNGPFPALAPERMLSFGLDDDYATMHADLIQNDPGRSTLAHAWRKKLSLVLTAADLPVPPRQLDQNIVVDRLWRPRGLFHPLAIVMMLDGNRQSILSLRRNTEKPDFGARERAIGRLLMPFLGASLNRVVLREQAADLGRIIERATSDRGVQVGLIAFDSALQLVHADAAVTGIATQLCEDRPLLSDTRDWLIASKQSSRLIVMPDSQGVRRRLVFEIAADARDNAALLVRVDPQGTALPSDQRLAAFGLTPREIEVTLAVLDGLNNEAIGTRLEITRTTVAKHLQQVMAKLSVRSRTQIASRLGEPLSLDGIAGMERLTPRERAAVETMARGMNSAQAAASLHISRGTYANQLRAAARKLNVPGRHGLLPLLRGEDANDAASENPLAFTASTAGTITHGQAAPAQLLRSLTEAVRAHGFHASVFHTLLRESHAELPIRPGWGAQDSDSPAFTNWREGYVQKHSYRGDPMFHASVDAVHPLISAWDFSSGRVFGDVERQLQPSEIALARDVTRVTGAHSGVAVPINSARGDAGLIIFLSAAGGAGAAVQHRNVLARLSELSASFHHAIRHQIPKADATRLDDREIACLELLAQGYSVRDIAKSLSISTRSVAHHLAGADRKFGSGSRYQTLARASAAGIIKPWS